MATIKTSEHADQPKAVHVGVNRAIMRVSLSATFSAGDIFYVGRIPHLAVVTDVVWIPGAAAAAAGVFHVGVNGNSLSAEALMASASYSLAVYPSSAPLAVLGNRGRAQWSLSDERAVRYSDIAFTPEIAVSVGHIGDLVIDYVLDDPA